MSNYRFEKALLDEATENSNLIETKTDASKYAERWITKIPTEIIKSCKKDNIPFTVFARRAIVKLAKEEGYI